MVRTVKRYENRKLYDTREKRYVSLEELARFIREGEEIKVVDNVSGKDITEQTLIQVILEQGKKGKNPFSTQALHDIIRWGNTILDDGLRQIKENIERVLPKTMPPILDKSEHSELEKLKKRVEALENLLGTIEKMVDEKITEQDASLTGKAEPGKN